MQIAWRKTQPTGDFLKATFSNAIFAARRTRRPCWGCGCGSLTRPLAIKRPWGLCENRAIEAQFSPKSKIRRLPSAVSPAFLGPASRGRVRLAQVTDVVAAQRGGAQLEERKLLRVVRTPTHSDFWPNLKMHFERNGFLRGGIRKVLRRKSQRCCAWRIRGGNRVSIPPKFGQSGGETQEISASKDGGFSILAFFGHLLTKSRAGFFGGGIRKSLQCKFQKLCAGRTRGGKGLCPTKVCAKQQKIAGDIASEKWRILDFGQIWPKMAIFTKSPKSLASSQLRFPFS